MNSSILRVVGLTVFIGSVLIAAAVREISLTNKLAERDAKIAALDAKVLACEKTQTAAVADLKFIDDKVGEKLSNISGFLTKIIVDREMHEIAEFINRAEFGQLCRQTDSIDSRVATQLDSIKQLNSRLDGLQADLAELKAWQKRVRLLEVNADGWRLLPIK